MRKLLIILCLLSFAFAYGQKEIIPSKPNPPRLVNDYTNSLTPEQRDVLERKLVNYDDSTSNQIAIVILKDLGGYEPAQYATELGEKWGVGGAKFDNGIVILVSLGNENESRKAFIAVGRGLEGAIPDMTAGYIFDEYLVPNLRAGNFYQAFDQATYVLIKAAAGEYKAPEGYRKRNKSGGGGFSLGKLIPGIIILFVILSIFGGGNRGGGYMSRRGYRGFGGPTIFPTGGGWGSSSGGGWSGGSGGGGFGGFGGGSFGGGGAGGNW